MNVVLVSVGGGLSRSRAAPEAVLLEEYRRRSAQYVVCTVRTYPDVDAMLQAAERERKRRPLRLVLLDSAGESLASDAFAARLRQYRDGGVQEVWVATGPADGWRGDTLTRADLRLSLGAMTLPHRLAQVVIAEQVYRALTILAGHPYHCGH